MERISDRKVATCPKGRVGFEQKRLSTAPFIGSFVIYREDDGDYRDEVSQPWSNTRNAGEEERRGV